MKKILTFLAIMIFSFSLSAQLRGTYQNSSDGYRNGDNYRYANYSDDSRYSNDRRYRDNERGSYRNRRSRVSFYSLSYRDQKRIKKLNRKLEKAERKAWKDGYLNRRERKCIREISNDIDLVWAKYERNNNRYANSCTGR